MPLVTLEHLGIRFRGPSLFDDISAQVEPGQRIGLLGRNGAGKSTLLNILSGSITPDHGQVAVADGVVIARLPQEVPRNLRGSVHDIVLHAVQTNSHETAEDWETAHRIDKTLAEMQLDPAAEVNTLSSGLKRRVLLAASLANQPDLLLLDEPTNHLDIDSILWLENFLKRLPSTLIFITHDRTFLQNLATRIWEIDRGQLFDWSCDYATFLQRKEAALEAEEKQQALFDKKLAEEEAWIRQGIKARRTRNEGRVRALKQMRAERAERRKAVGKVDMKLQSAQRSGQLVAELKNIHFARGDKLIISDFTSTIMRGDKVGIIGPNGAGKTTLLKLILGQLEPDAGSVRLGTNLEVAYFDQLRDQLDEEKSVIDNVAEGSDRVQIGGQSKHAIGYLQDFLFTPERARTEVKFLSGGERNRVLLAKLMTKPANIIVLDEPTNDLDTETLEMLEAQLVDFDGTVLLVSHDRAFLNHLVTSTIVFEDDEVHEYVGGYDDWQRTVAQRLADAKKSAAADAKSANSKNNNKSAQPKSAPPKSASRDSKKLSYKETRELEALPERIESLEQTIAERHQAMADPAYYKQPPELLAENQRTLDEHQAELEAAYQRWEELEARANP